MKNIFNKIIKYWIPGQAQDDIKSSGMTAPAGPSKEKGVAILFAVLVAVLLVSIAATIVSIALRQTILSSTGRESQIAFYTANTAMECALYWDLNPVDGSTSGRVFPVFDLSQETDTTGVSCAGDDFPNYPERWYQVGDRTEFELNITNSHTDQTYCASVDVEKDYDVDTKETTTTINVRGYNVDSCNSTSPRAVERGLELSYTS
jgi:type II secretory pathway pseudopilin PulG